MSKIIVYMTIDAHARNCVMGLQFRHYSHLQLH